LKTPRFFSSFAIPLDAAPRMKPAEPGLRLHPSWTGSPDDCQACSRCCIQVHCPMLDRKTGICLSYGSFYWRYFNCGRYPANQFQIDCYRCPKWLFTKKFPE
jgi:hypothetical protein